jgi:hypothetical protein
MEVGISVHISCGIIQIFGFQYLLSVSTFCSVKSFQNYVPRKEELCYVSLFLFVKSVV